MFGLLFILDPYITTAFMQLFTSDPIIKDGFHAIILFQIIIIQTAFTPLFIKNPSMTVSVYEIT